MCLSPGLVRAMVGLLRGKAAAGRERLHARCTGGTFGRGLPPARFRCNPMDLPQGEGGRSVQSARVLVPCLLRINGVMEATSCWSHALSFAWQKGARCRV